MKGGTHKTQVQRCGKKCRALEMSTREKEDPVPHIPKPQNNILGKDPPPMSWPRHTVSTEVIIYKGGLVGRGVWDTHSHYHCVSREQNNRSQGDERSEFLITAVRCFTPSLAKKIHTVLLLVAIQVFRNLITPEQFFLFILICYPPCTVHLNGYPSLPLHPTQYFIMFVTTMFFHSILINRMGNEIMKNIRLTWKSRIQLDHKNPELEIIEGEI